MSVFSFMRQVAAASKVRADSDPDQTVAAARSFSDFAEIGRGAYSDQTVAEGLLLAGALRLSAASDPVTTAHYLRAMAAVIERNAKSERKAG